MEEQLRCCMGLRARKLAQTFLSRTKQAFVSCPRTSDVKRVSCSAKRTYRVLRTMLLVHASSHSLCSEGYASLLLRRPKKKRSLDRRLSVQPTTCSSRRLSRALTRSCTSLTCARTRSVFLRSAFQTQSQTCNQ